MTADRAGGDAAEGVVFPLVEGRRSSLAAGQAVLADAAQALDVALAADLRQARDWRRSYPAYLRRLEAAGVRDPSGAVRAAEAGLASLHRRLELVREGAAVPLAEALATGLAAPGEEPSPRHRGRDDALGTETVRGSGDRVRELVVPYAGRLLRGDDLHRQLAAWVRAGTVEPSFAEAVGSVVRNPDWLDLSDRAFGLLGAGAEMAPLSALLSWGAEVLAVDVPDPRVWERIRAAARAGAGRLHVPVGAHSGAPARDRAGADLLRQAPEVRDWLAVAGRPLVLGNYGYAAGSAFLLLAAATDAVTEAVTEALHARGLSVSLAFLATPTDVFAVPPEVVEESRSRYTAFRSGRQVGGLRASRLAHRLTRARLYAPHYPDTVRGPDGCERGIADSLVLQQGPNYALAKRVQRWRAVLASTRGSLVSANVAPPTRTRSVLRNRLLAAAYDGAARFGVEVFEPATSNVLMAAALVADLRAPPSSAHPARTSGDPSDLLAYGAAHGGLWRSAFAPRSVLGLAVAAGLARSLRPGRSG